MLIDYGADIDAWAVAWAFPATPIISAVLSGNAQMVLLLIKKGASLGLGMSGQLALYCAAWDGQETMVRLLVECGVHVDGTYEELNPLLNAILEGQDQVAKILVELGAKRMDRLESNLVKEQAHRLAKGRCPFPKAGKSYDQAMLNSQRLDGLLFPSGWASLASRPPPVATSMN